ncbi:hypothetical protein FSP39_011965 [Pinctada imbricata]|uniref:LRRCT domain-containing protein n=1 Tax=Pinctada imbricata TaxID=66713 RepID=A0AA88YV28_PINIB|nr:hypothetical protein FSP39_011965 [Pinctada imbricata]
MDKMETIFILLYINLGYILVFAFGPCPLPACVCSVSATDPSKRSLDCQNRHLTSVPLISSTSPELFEKISLRNNDIKRFDGGNFRSARTEYLDVMQNKLEHIDRQAFCGLETKLKQLKMQGNRQVLVPFPSFQNLTVLEELYLKDFTVTGLDVNTNFRCLQSLRTLRLINVRMDFITSQAFVSNLKLQTLQLDSCMINATFPTLAFTRLTNLQNLFLANNGFTIFPSRSLMNARQLVHLDLSHNPLQTYERKSFYGISPTLEHLILSHTGLNETHLAALSSYNWNKLRHFDISHNALRDIPNGCFNKMPMLTSLDLSFNAIVEVSSFNLTYLRKLEAINLSGNHITLIDVNFFTKLDGILMMNLSEMNSTINFQFASPNQHTPHLHWKELILSNSKISEDTFEKFIPYLPSLEILKLDNSRVTHIDGIFKGNSKLRHLSLRSNRLAILSKDAFGGLEHSLEYLDIRENEITTVSKCSFNQLEEISVVKLSKNNFRCDCKLKWLMEWPTKSKTETDIDNIVCESPRKYRNRKFNILNESLKCSAEEKCLQSMSVTSDKSSISERHLYLMIIMLLVLLASFIVIFGVVLLMLKFKKSRAQSALDALYKKSIKDDK